MSAWIHPILFCMLNYDSTCIARFIGVSRKFPLRQREILCIRTGIRVGSALFLIPHLTSFFLRFFHVWSLFLHLNMLGVCSFAWPHFLGQAGVVNDPRICINLSVGSSFSARYVAHI